jgi:hypothetical protein
MRDTSAKINRIVQDVKDNMPGYEQIEISTIRLCIKYKFKCSTYMANLAIKKLIEDEGKTD